MKKQLYFAITAIVLSLKLLCTVLNPILQGKTLWFSAISFSTVAGFSFDHSLEWINCALVCVAVILWTATILFAALGIKKRKMRLPFFVCFMAATTYGLTFALMFHDFPLQNIFWLSSIAIIALSSLGLAEVFKEINAKKGEKTLAAIIRNCVVLLNIFVWFVLWFLIISMVDSVAALESFEYLYPMLDNSKLIIFLVTIGIIALFADVICLAVSAFGKIKIFTITKIASGVSCVVLVLTTTFLAFVNFSRCSYTEDLDNYLIFDDYVGSIAEVKKYFPEKEALITNETYGQEIDYSYRYDYSGFYTDYEYEIMLSCNLEGENTYENIYAGLLTSYKDSIIYNGEETIFVILDMQTEWKSIKHEIIANSKLKTIIYYAEAVII